MSSGIRRSIAFSVADRYASIALGFVTTIILSRLLTPKDFGIFSIAMSFVVLADIFRDFGTGNYLVQAKQLTDQQLRTAFTSFLATSALCGLVLLLGAPALVSFYGDGLFWQLMPVFAFNLMLGPFSVPETRADHCCWSGMPNSAEWPTRVPMIARNDFRSTPRWM